VTHGFRLLMTHDQKQEMVLQPHSPVTQGVCDFWDDKKGKVLAIGVVKVNDHFTLNDCMCFFKSLIREFMTQSAILFVVFLRSEMSFRPISHLLSLP
jgi:hypothetical protein